MKQLLSVILIAGLSATANAEPTVYYCEMTAHNELSKSGFARNLNLQQFSMKIEAKTLSFKGLGVMNTVAYQLRENYDPNAGFFASTRDHIFFLDSILTVSRHLPGFNIVSFIAECERF